MTALTTHAAQQAQELLAQGKAHSANLDLLINAKKTKFIYHYQPVKHLQAPFWTLEDFRYLGSHVESSEKNIRIRKASAWRALNKMTRIW